MTDVVFLLVALAEVAAQQEYMKRFLQRAPALVFGQLCYSGFWISLKERSNFILAGKPACPISLVITTREGAERGLKRIRPYLPIRSSNIREAFRGTPFSSVGTNFEAKAEIRKFPILNFDLVVSVGF